MLHDPVSLFITPVFHILVLAFCLCRVLNVKSLSYVCVQPVQCSSGSIKDYCEYPLSPRSSTVGNRDRRPDLKTVTPMSTLSFSFFVSIVFTVWMPEYLLTRLERGDKALEDHTRLLLLQANTISYPDDTLCAFYDACLNRAPSSEDGPRGDFAAFVQWTLASATPDPMPSPPSPRCQSIARRDR